MTESRDEILEQEADPYTKKDIHFMPCLLKPDPNVEVECDHELLSALPYSPLLLIPSTGFVPLGLFSYLGIAHTKAFWVLFQQQNRIPTDVLVVSSTNLESIFVEDTTRL